MNSKYYINKDPLEIDEIPGFCSLLFHENIIDVLSKYDDEESVQYYLKILKNICFSDYIDRITFQNQIWQFNEMSSMIKTFYNNSLQSNGELIEILDYFDRSDRRVSRNLSSKTE